MTEENQDVTIYSGDTRLLSVTVYDENDDLVDISGGIIDWIVRSYPGATLSYISKSTLQGTTSIELDEPASGSFIIYLYPTDSANLAGRYYHEAQLTDVSGDVFTLFSGILNIKEDAVR